MALEPLTALAFLSLEGCTNIGDGIQNLPPLPALTHLDIGSIDASSGRGLARALSPLTALHHLSLRGCTALRESDLKEAIPHLTSLMSLWLTECTHIKDEGVASLSPLMSLTYLDLSNTQVRQEGNCLLFVQRPSAPPLSEKFCLCLCA